MYAAAHVLATLVVIPYALLGLAFVLLGRAASSGGLASLFDVMLAEATWLVPWGALGAAIGTFALMALGMSPHTRKAGAITLCALALACIATIAVLSTRRIGLGELAFLLPCIGVAAFAGWLASVQ